MCFSPSDSFNTKRGTKRVQVQVQVPRTTGWVLVLDRVSVRFSWFLTWCPFGSDLSSGFLTCSSITGLFWSFQTGSWFHLIWIFEIFWRRVIKMFHPDLDSLSLTQFKGSEKNLTCSFRQMCPPSPPPSPTVQLLSSDPGSGLCGFPSSDCLLMGARLLSDQPPHKQQRRTFSSNLFVSSKRTST